MRMVETLPDVNPEAWLSAKRACEVLGMDRTTFWRKVKEGYIKRRWRPIEQKFRYQGKELIRVWRLLR